MQNTKTTSTLRGPFLFSWPKPVHGELRVVSELPKGPALSGTKVEPSREIVTGLPVPEEHRSGPWLVVDYPPWRDYAPLSIPDLHRRFSRIKPTEGGILRFASRYGPLGHGAFMDHRLRPARYEALAVWHKQVAIMRRWVEIWDAIRREDAGRLGQWIHWGKNQMKVSWNDKNPQQSPFGEFQLLGDSERPMTDPIPENWRVGDVVEPARYYLSRRISERLHGHVNPQIHPFLKGDIMLIPDCLQSAMYVQFAIEISGKDRPPIICKGCGRYFNAVHGTQRYCEKQCRQRKWWTENKSPKSHEPDQQENHDND